MAGKNSQMIWKASETSCGVSLTGKTVIEKKGEVFQDFHWAEGKGLEGNANAIA